jgi:hypothetical protein
MTVLRSRDMMVMMMMKTVVMVRSRVKVIVFQRADGQSTPFFQETSPCIPLSMIGMRIEDDAHPEAGQLIPQDPTLVRDDTKVRRVVRRPPKASPLR